MKIQKFNESLEEDMKDCWICVISQGKDIINTCVSETKLDIENWLLNHINEEVASQTIGEPEGIVYNEDDEPIFINLENANEQSIC